MGLLKKSLFTKLILPCLFFPFLCSCSGNNGITSAVLDENYPDTLYVGDVNFSDFKFNVTHTNGLVEQIPVTRSMVDENDLYKFYQPGNWKIRFNYYNFYSIAEFTILINEFSDDIHLINETVAYDGQSHGLSIGGSLPEGTEVYYPSGNSFIDSSPTPYKITAILTKDGYNAKTLTGELTINKAYYDQSKLDAIIFEDKEFVYDGNEKSIEAENVPDDITVSYSIEGNPGNKMVDAGEYYVRADFNVTNPNYYPIHYKIAKLTILKATYNLSGVHFNDKSFVYDGKIHSLEVTGAETLPSDVHIEYVNNGKINADTYEVIAKFTGNINFNPINDMHAYMYILPQSIDLGHLNYPPQEVNFTGEIQEYNSFEGKIPTILYPVCTYFHNDQEAKEVKEPVDPGEYIVVVSFLFVDGAIPSNFELINVPTKCGLLVIHESQGV